MSDVSSLVQERTLWITSRHVKVDGRRARDYMVCSDTGLVLLTARSYVWGREIVMRSESGEEVLLLRRRRLFPFTGRVDLCEPSGRAIGAVYRNGRYADSGGRELGRFRDRRRMRDRAGEAVLQGVFEALVSGDGSTTGSAPRAYACLAGGELLGSLVLTRLPYVPAGSTQRSAFAALSERMLPGRAVTALKAAAAPTGWRLDRNERLATHDALVLTGAALFMVELSHW